MQLWKRCEWRPWQEAVTNKKEETLTTLFYLFIYLACVLLNFHNTVVLF